MIKLTRRSFLRLILGLSFAGVGSGVYMRMIEPKWLKISQVPVNLLKKSLSPPIKILHLSDFHVSKYISVSFIESAINLGLSYEPDMVCITGDFILKKINKNEFREYTGILKRCAREKPTFACLGNHDGGEWALRNGGYKDTNLVVKLLQNAGIIILINNSIKLRINDNNIVIVGIDDFWSNSYNPNVAFSKIKKNEKEPCIVLSHNPDSKEILGNYNWDLMLCGHTHGGQIFIPGIGTPFAPIKDHKFVAGLNIWKNHLIYKTKGVGNLRGLRFNCRPEVSLLSVS